MPSCTKANAPGPRCQVKPLRRLPLLEKNKERDLRVRWGSLIAYLQRYHTDAQASFFVTVRKPCRFTGGHGKPALAPLLVLNVCSETGDCMTVDTRAHAKTLPDTGRKRSLAQKAYQIVNTFSGDVGGGPAPPTFCHFFHTLKPLAEPVASWSGLAMYAHFYTGFSGNVIDFPTRRDKRASRAQNRRFPGTGSIPHNLFRAISR